MCTLLSLNSEDGKTLFGRTMDFSFELEPEILVFPRGYTWDSLGSKVINKYKFMGTGQNIGKEICAEGVNEKGLGAAALYFAGYASYDEIKDNQKQIAALEFVNYVLGNCSNTDEVISFCENLSIVGMNDPVTGTLTPLHFFVTDKNKSITIEKVKEGLKIYDNNVGVMTNSPEFSYHLTNLRNYMNASPYQYEEAIWKGFTLKPFGQGGGTILLPGDYTSPSRFVKTVFQRSCVTSKNEKEAVINGMHILDSVSIPKGVVISKNGNFDYTQYTSFICLNSQKYYIKTYNRSAVRIYQMDNINSNKVESLGKIN